jgi:mono/diheme cytochrome c family protein
MGSVVVIVGLGLFTFQVGPGETPALAVAVNQELDTRPASSSGCIVPLIERPGAHVDVDPSTPSGDPTRSFQRFSHIRSDDSSAQALVIEAASKSYTVSRLLDLIERSSAIVYVSLSPPPWILQTSQTKLIAGRTNGCRYLSVWIDDHLWPTDRIQMLGHELQHVAEIADAPEVVSEADLMRLYQRIGYTSWRDRAFETYGARVVQMLVGEELESGDDTGGSPRDPVRLADAEDPHPKQLFGAYCAACHGRDGRGRGPAAPIMRATPPDLSVLSKRSGGAFPWSDVEVRIRATDRRPPASIAEGMPVWRPFSSHEPAAGPADHARDIAAYVESLQRR